MAPHPRAELCLELKRDESFVRSKQPKKKNGASQLRLWQVVTAFVFHTLTCIFLFLLIFTFNQPSH